jgi:hypothetical protein
MPSTALLVHHDAALEQLRRKQPEAMLGGTTGAETGTSSGPPTTAGGGTPSPTGSALPRRFYGSVEIDMVRPVKSFDAILNAVVMELQRTQGTKVKLKLEVEAEAPSGFPEADVGVVRDKCAPAQIQGRIDRL